MYCSNCGKEIDNEAVVCPNCGVLTEKGKDVNNGSCQQKQKLEFWLLSIILSGCGFITVWFVTIIGLLLSISGLVLGVLSLRNEKSKKNIAIISVVLAGVTMLIVIAVFIWSILLINGLLNTIVV